jgi:putative transposase
VVKPSSRREMALSVVQTSQLSIRAACVAFSISETCYRYQPKHSSESDATTEHEVKSQRLDVTHAGAERFLCDV